MAGVGFAGGLSAQVGIGYSFKSQDFSAFVGASFAFNSIYASYSFSNGGSVGYTFGLSIFSGTPVSSNFGSVGMNYNFSNNSWSGNASAWHINHAGVTFDPSVSIAVFSDRTTNLVRGQGFKSNDQVLAKFVQQGNYQGALDYFGFEGTYDPNKPKGAEYAEGRKYYAAADPITGAIQYGYDSFSSYANLKAMWIKESFISRRAIAGKIESQEPIGTFKKYFPEERASFTYAYKNGGRFLSSSLGKYFLNQAQAYEAQSYNILPKNRVSFNWVQKFIFKIPRR
ncbi:hypothetical protein CLV98_1483 [Dyadobacter jejuensis]|uniref:Bacterial toxin 23 domain-containing protein n=2 Tax=Dyadobacter jejuensis TaxID=1082580 RepID=A0A315ZVB9_9BACT|nr:hypothetical protein CLV98_1483 [Dyadobacter jejuensis]